MANAQPTSKVVEEWRSIEGWEGYYEVSNLGSVRSCSRVVPHSFTGFSTIRERTLKPSAHQHGHLMVSLRRGGVGKTHYVHRLVARAFLGEIPDGMEVCHNDGDPSNNRVENLRFGTSSANSWDSVKHGTHAMLRRIKCPRGHLLKEQNLVPSRTKLGHRECLSCNRARSYLKTRPELKPYLQQVSDSYYAGIMK